MEIKEWLTLINLFLITIALFIAFWQLNKTTKMARLSALAQLSVGQASFFDMMLRNDEILSLFYKGVTREEAKKRMFLTLVINNLNLEFDQIKHKFPDKKEREAYSRHIRKEFTNPELKERLKNTSECYDPAYINFVLDP